MLPLRRTSEGRARGIDRPKEQPLAAYFVLQNRILDAQNMHSSDSCDYVRLAVTELCLDVTG